MHRKIHILRGAATYPDMSEVRRSRPEATASNLQPPTSYLRGIDGPDCFGQTAVFVEEKNVPLPAGNTLDDAFSR